MQGSSARIDDDKTGKEKSDILLHSTRKKRSRGGFPGCQTGNERSTVECVPAERRAFADISEVFRSVNDDDDSRRAKKGGGRRVAKR